MVMPLQSYDKQISMESGLWLIQMKDDDGKTTVKALVVVK